VGLVTKARKVASIANVNHATRLGTAGDMLRLRHQGRPNIFTETPGMADHSGMNVTIRNIPGDVYRCLKELASEQGRSLNAHIVYILTREAAEWEHRRRMRATRNQLERFVASLPKMNDSARLIRNDRDR
jgi:hypothetical protein